MLFICFVVLSPWEWRFTAEICRRFMFMDNL